MEFNFRREKICVLHVENRRQASTEYGMALQTRGWQRYIITLNTEFHASVSYIGVHK
jgi:hypothetical protein